MLNIKKLDLGSTPSKAVDFDVIIGRSTTLEGTINSGGSVRLDGKITGDIQAQGEVIVGQDAIITGNVSSQNIEISGQVTGNITSPGCLKIYSSGYLKGNIEVTSFVIDEGGSFEGLCHINMQPNKDNLPKEKPIIQEDQKPDVKLVK